MVLLCELVFPGIRIQKQKSKNGKPLCTNIFIAMLFVYQTGNQIRSLDVRGRLSKLWACLLTGIVGGFDNMESVD